MIMINIGLECESIETDSWGISRSIKELLKELAQRSELKNEFKFFLYFKKRPAGPESELFIKCVAHISSFSLYYYLWLPWATRKDHLDLMFFPNYMLPFGVKPKTMVTLTEDGYEAMNSKWLPWRFKLAYRIFMNHAAKVATVINAYSRTSADEVSRCFGIDPAKIFINHLGVSVPKTITYDLKPKIFPYVLCVGQMFPRRHVQETILAFKKIAPEFPELKLVLVGIDKYNPPVIASLIDDKIIWKECVGDDELAALYANAKLFVYVSTNEAFGLPPLEALTYGIRPIVADTPISHELFDKDAIYTQPTVDAITAAIYSALRATIQQAPVIKFTWQAHTDRFLNLCRKFQS